MFSKNAMGMSRRRRGLMRGLGLCFLGLGLHPGPVWSQAVEPSENLYTPDAMGMRGGFSADDKEQGFIQAEAYARWDLPWAWEWGDNWGLATSGDLSLGYITDKTLDGFVGSLGPVFSVHRKSLPVVFELGSSPTVLSRDSYRRAELGTWFQFTSHGGIRWRISDHFDLAYRFQHMSNAGISRVNPGLNMHMFSAGFQF